MSKKKSLKNYDLKFKIGIDLFSGIDEFSDFMVELMLLFKEYGIKLKIPTSLGVYIDADDFPEEYTLGEYLDGDNL